MGPITTLLLLLTLSGCNFAQLLDGCSDPPGNNQLAGIIAGVLENVRPILVHGIPDLGIPPLDPLGPLGHTSFHVDTSAIKLDGSVNDTKVMKLSEYIICQVNMTLGLAQKFTIDLRLHNFHAEGFYNVDGIAFSLFPVFGNGDFRLDVYDVVITGGAKMTYNPFTDHAAMKDLQLGIYFNDLELEMECILGCGDMSDLVNSVVSDIAPPMFFAIWNNIEPILTQALQDGINDILKNISISDIITLETRRAMQLGNANVYMDLVMKQVAEAIIDVGLDPATLPYITLDFALGQAELYDGQLTGLSTLKRSGTSTFDKVADWVFLYANMAVDDLAVHYVANVTSGTTVYGVVVHANIKRVAVYMVARANIYNFRVDLDQFIISEFGKIDVKIDGLGLLDYVVGPLTEAVANMVRESVANIIETIIKQIIQQILNENPWPMQ